MPIAANAQELIAVPDDLDLDSAFCENIAGLMAIDDVAFDQHHRYRTHHGQHKYKQRQHTQDGNEHEDNHVRVESSGSGEEDEDEDADDQEDDNSSLSDDDNFDL